MADTNLTIRDQHDLPTPPESGTSQSLKRAVTASFNEAHRVLDKLANLPEPK